MAPRAARWRHHRTPLFATLAVLPLYVVWWIWLATGGGDLAAQEAWAQFVARDGGSAYNLSWFGGAHVVNYSVLSPYLMAGLGVRVVSVVSGLAATWLTAVLLLRCGARRPLGAALVAALMLWCDVAAGRTTFALGVAIGLAACVLVTRHRGVLPASACAATAAMSSPVAGLFLVVVGAAYLAVRDWGRAVALLAPPVAVVAATTLFFPYYGQQPMPFLRLLAPVLLGLAVTVLAPTSWRVVRWTGLLYVAGAVLVYLIPSPIGTNVERLAWIFAAPVLFAAWSATPSRARVRRLALIVGVVLSICWVVPGMIVSRMGGDPVPAWASHTDGVIHALEDLGADRTRVEAVPAQDHREASVLAAHVTLARGWNTQLDMRRGRLFYDGSFSATAYRSWLHRWAVGLIALPATEPDRYARQEARLLREAPPHWLRPVWHDAYWQVFRVQNATPMVSGAARIIRMTSAEVDLRVPTPGSVSLRVVYSPWLHVDGGCLSRDGEFTTLTVATPGEYRIGSKYADVAEGPAECAATGHH
ncbi:hypothetical protein AB0D74_48970 [Streptomyces sp. NPDC048278]|uniref:hypothetical protein n=1 Tax=Streptomyces sp. NPDC048278 TaxID=3155809 RepID=UPI0034293B8B